jgi:hypothetical protein
MLHTFSCNAYEIADHTFENLRKYGMMMDEVLETRDLKFYNIDLTKLKVATDLTACLATVHASPGTVFLYQL